MVEDFHEKFHVSKADTPRLIDDETALNRYKFMREEVEEYLEGTLSKDLQNIAKELCDILYTTYGTIVAHGLQNKIEEVFMEVHRSNMSKDYHPIKAKKGKNYVPADIEQFFGNK